MTGSAHDLGAVLEAFPGLGRVHQPPAACSGGFSGAGVWKVECDAGTFALRRWPSHTEPDEIASLHRLLEHVRDRGVDLTPVPVRTARKQTVVRFARSLWHLEPWMPGVADFRSDPSDDRLADAMRALAAWHHAAASFQSTAAESPRFAPPCRGVAFAVVARAMLISELDAKRLDRLERAIDASPADAMQPLSRAILSHFRRRRTDVAMQLEMAKHLRVPLQACLRDVWHDHVLYTGHRVTGLIDPSAAATDTVAADLSRLLGSLVGNDTQAQDRALTAYLKHNSLTSEEMQLVPILDLSGVLLSGMTWLVRRYLDGKRLEPWDAVVNRLRQIVSRLNG